MSNKIIYIKIVSYMNSIYQKKFLPIGNDKWVLAGLAITTVGVLPAIAVVTTVVATI